jgi:hypothetical protein
MPEKSVMNEKSDPQYKKSEIFGHSFGILIRKLFQNL